mmetsp:Transcript_11937/g.28628  ORF Transcript_11937/g.28628 Transcript_11937/m.28628 type:complete len:201 (+) Transcript_11937:318-920(+)
MFQEGLLLEVLEQGLLGLFGGLVDVLGRQQLTHTYQPHPHALDDVPFLVGVRCVRFDGLFLLALLFGLSLGGLVAATDGLHRLGNHSSVDGLPEDPGLHQTVSEVEITQRLASGHDGPQRDGILLDQLAHLVQPLFHLLLLPGACLLLALVRGRPALLEDELGHQRRGLVGDGCDVHVGQTLLGWTGARHFGDSGFEKAE